MVYGWTLSGSSSGSRCVLLWHRSNSLGWSFANQDGLKFLFACLVGVSLTFFTLNGDPIEIIGVNCRYSIAARASKADIFDWALGKESFCERKLEYNARDPMRIPKQTLLNNHSTGMIGIIDFKYVKINVWRDKLSR